MATLIVSIQNLRDQLAFENLPMWEMKRQLEKQGILNELVTPYNELSSQRDIKAGSWKLIYRISRISGFSWIYLLLLYLMTRELYLQIRINADEFDSIIAFDLLSAYAAALACRNRIPVYLMNQDANSPWKEYTSANRMPRYSLGHKLLCKILSRLTSDQRLHISALPARVSAESLRGYSFLRAG